MKKIKIKLKVIHIIMIFFILLSLILICEIINLNYKLKNKEIVVNELKSNVEEETLTRKTAKEEREKMLQKGNIDINSELIKDLYSRLFKSNFIANDYEGSFYKNEKTTIDTLSNTEKSVAILTYLENKGKTRVEEDAIDINVLKRLFHYSEKEDFVDEIRVYPKEEVEDAVNKIFGKNVEIQFENFMGCGESFEYIDGAYYAYEFPGGGFGATNVGFGQIQYAITDGDFVYIYDRFIYKRYFDIETNYKEYRGKDLTAYYASSEDDKYVAIHGVNVQGDEYEITDDIIYDLSVYLNLYKHTFKKSETGEYYWVSTEIAEESKR